MDQQSHESSSPRVCIGDAESKPSEVHEEEEEIVEAKPQHNERLAGSRPLMTILKLMVGPVILQVTGALYGIISTMWVSKAIGPLGVSAVSAYTAFDNIGRAFGFFLSVSASTKISQLFGQGKADEAGQVICDLMRVALVCGAIVPAILFPVMDPCCRWFGASDDVIDLGRRYFSPIAGCSFFTCLYVACQGFLQGEGRTLLVGLIALASLCVSMFVFQTTLLFGFKTGIEGAGWSTALADIIPGVTVSVLFLSGKFTVKPKWRQLCKPFSKHTWSALRVGISQLVSNLSISIPGIVIRKLIGESVPPEEFNNAIAGYNMVFRYAMVTTCVVIGCNMGYIPAASYANAAKLYKRLLRLTLHCFWINLAWCVLTTIFSWAIPREISKVFGSGEDYLKWAAPMLKYGNALGFIMFIRINAQSFLQALRYASRTIIMTFTVQLASLIIFALILFYTDRHNAVRICWSYPLAYAFGVGMAAFMLTGPMIKVVRLYKEQISRIGQEGVNRQEEDDMASDGKELEDIENADEASASSSSSSASSSSSSSSKEISNGQEEEGSNDHASSEARNVPEL